MILVVEDSDVIREVMTLLLEGEGYSVISTDRGPDAVQLAQRELPDVVTLDLALAGSDGRDVLRRLKSDPATARIPIVIVSAFTEALQAPDRWYADDVIPKPFEINDLLVRLERLIDR